VKERVWRGVRGGEEGSGEGSRSSRSSVLPPRLIELWISLIIVRSSLYRPRSYKPGLISRLPGGTQVQRDGAVPTLRTVTATKGRYSSLTPPPWLFIDHLYTLIGPGLDSVFVVRIESPRNEILTEFD
jgi:hypothetical protein